MKPLARGAQQLPGSGIREIVHIAIEMPDVIRLEVGEPNFATPQHIVAGAFQGVEDGFTKYTASSGLLSLRELLAEKVNRLHGHDVTPDNINVGIGAVELIMAATIAVVERGEEVLIPDPAWPNYEMIVRICEGVPVLYPLHMENDFVPRVEDIEPLITERTKMLILNSPANPSGAVFPRQAIEDLVDLAQRHDLYILADEVYDELIYEGEHVSPARYDATRTLSIYSFSKTYAMTGWRIGYIVTNTEIAALIKKLQEPLISSVSSVSQKAAEAALAGPQDCIEEMRSSYMERRDAIVELLKERDAYVYLPRGAFYILIDISRSGLDSRSFALSLLRERAVAVAPGGAFGQVGDHLVRVSLATEKDKLLEGVDHLCDHMEQLAQTQAVEAGHLTGQAR